jgi:hypothetical protein
MGAEVPAPAPPSGAPPRIGRTAGRYQLAYRAASTKPSRSGNRSKPIRIGSPPISTTKPHFSTNPGLRSIPAARSAGMSRLSRFPILRGRLWPSSAGPCGPDHRGRADSRAHDLVCVPRRGCGERLVRRRAGCQSGAGEDVEVTVKRAEARTLWTKVQYIPARGFARRSTAVANLARSIDAEITGQPSATHNSRFRAYSDFLPDVRQIPPLSVRI